MTQVLIVSKTKMGKNGACIGGITIPDLKSVRLMNKDGSYHKVDTEFEVGQLWEMGFKSALVLTPPHYENVLIKSENLLSVGNEIKDLIDNKKLNAIVSKGDPSQLFEGLLGWTGNGHGYISKAGGIPDHSTGFWITNKNLSYVSPYYVYTIKKGFFKINRGFKYVGFADPIPVIPAGTKIRISLAKWWRPDNIEIEERCYLQLSGWY